MKINVCRLKSQTEKLDQVSVRLLFFADLYIRFTYAPKQADK